MSKDQFIQYDFIGAGISLIPGLGLHVSGEGNLALMAGERDIIKSIYIILSTAPGERVMRPEFGCGIHNYVFAAIGPGLFSIISYEVRNSLARWEPRIEVEDVITFADPDEPERLLVNITYSVRQTNNRRNLVYPFYNIPRGND
jgi:phage baseplate assembly protein W